MGFTLRPPNRAAPTVPVHLMRTYRVVNPISTHFRPATCADVACAAYLHGWKVLILDEADPVWIMRVEYFENKLTPRCDRRYREYRDEHGTRIFEFEAGQECFATDNHRGHLVPLEREPFYVVQDGDWRGNPTGMTRTHTKAEHFAEELHHSVDTVSTAKQKG